MSGLSVSTTNRLDRWVPAAIFLVTLALASLGLAQGGDRLFADFLIQVKVKFWPLPVSKRVQPVDLNDRAERNLGTQIDSRKAFTKLFQVMGDGQLAGGMDFLFAGVKDPDQDRQMVQAAAQMDALVLAAVPIDRGITQFSGRQLSGEEQNLLKKYLWHPRVTNPGLLPVADTFLLPHLALAQTARYLGHIGVRPDSDGIYRKTPLFFRWGDGYIPCFALALATVALKIDPSQVEIDAGNAVILPVGKGSVRIPVDEGGNAWIPYPGTWQAWERTPLDTVVAAADDPEKEDEVINAWTGSVVVAADLTTGHKDFGPTPMDAVYPLSGIHTALVNGILTNRFYSPLPGGGQLALVLALLLIVVWIPRLPRFFLTHLGFALAILVLLGGTAGAWFLGLYLPWVTGPLLALALAWAAAVALRVIRQRQEKLLLENALSRYIPRALASRMLQEKQVDLKPASKELTILFSDISGFTRWSSDKSPSVVHGFLSEYLESMAEIVFDHGGTVDKFMGDGLMAFFGDPFDLPDHAARALQAALAMQAKVADLGAKWEPQVGIDLKIRIGVNTGPVIVGNLGKGARIEYTVIGAAVNQASRMESNAPVGGILVTEETWHRTNGAFEFSAPQEVLVKGYEEPIRAYVVRGTKPGPKP